jgi:hypothetical protein
MNFFDGLWYGTLIITETILLPYYEVADIVERANKNYKKYKSKR